MSYTVTSNTITKNPKVVGTKQAVKTIVPLALTYAQQQNSKYNSNGSIYVDLDKRFNDTISNLPILKQQGIRAQLIAACKEFSKKYPCLLYTSPSPRDRQKSRMPSSA